MPQLPRYLDVAYWGLFCACSWTWCIGLYLPLLLLDRFGGPGLVAFAVPNVVGCALFGYVIRTPQRSRRLVGRHAPAMRWFSAVTVVFHLYFAGYLTMYLVPVGGWAPIVAPAALLAVAMVVSLLPAAAWLVLTPVVYGVSLAAVAALGLEPLDRIPGAGDAAGELALLSPVLVLGFMLCPYLDRTFHRAIQSASRPHAFAVFGAAFAVMILLSALYWRPGSIDLRPIVAGHIALQCVFSVGAHLRELRGLSPARTGGAGFPIAALAIALGLVYSTGLFSDPAAAGIDLYVRFLVFYGLIFPAYVLLFIGPRGTLRPDRRGMAWLAAVVALALPAYELAFIHRMAWLLLLPVTAAVVWLARRL